MANIIMIIVWTLVVAAIGGGVGYFIWIKTRPNKIAWKARVYTLGEGIRPPKRNKDGEIISKEIRLSDLRPYGKDVLQRVEKAHGLIIYRLLRLNAPTPEPNASCVDYWGPEDKEVDVLKDGDSYTILTKGFDKKTSDVIFQPLAYETSTMLQNQAELRKSRLKAEKDVLAQITPWVVGGMALLFLFGIGYMFIEGNKEISDNNKEAALASAESTVEAATIYKEAIMIQKGIDPNTKSNNPNNQVSLGKQDKPPSVE